MLDAQTRYRIYTGLRRAYFMNTERMKVLKRCETATPAVKKDGNPKLRKGKQMMTRRYTCEICHQGGWRIIDFAVDHICPIGGTPGSRNTPKWWNWDIYIKRMFVKSKDMQGICKSCHHSKTKKDKEIMRSGKFYKDLYNFYRKTDV